MIEAVRSWIISLVMVTMLLSVVQSMIPEGRIKKTASFVGGLILMVVLLQPVLKVEGKHLTDQPEAYRRQIERYGEKLEQEACLEWESIISRETAAYISDKANALGLDISVEVLVDTGSDGIPVLTAELAGEPSEILEQYLAEELGIPRERQVWNHEGKN